MAVTGSGLLAAWRDVPGLRHGRPGPTAYMRLRASPDETPPPPRWTAIGDLSPYALCAIVGAEDPDFFAHNGVAWGRFARRSVSALRAGRRIGGVSTITQQLARNLYLHPRRSITRKTAEMALAGRMERALDKARILELYVNVAEWGRGVWGIGSAAEAWFGAAARELNPFQAVVLASLLPAPRAPLAGGNLNRALASQTDVLHFLYGAGVMNLHAWRETTERLMAAAGALRAGRPVDEVLRETGAPPYSPRAEIGRAPGAAELLASGCARRERAVYAALIHAAADRRSLMARLPLRWAGALSG
ncbi:biosynthetic peptidoglycan transglycosylase [Longimicrobium terrae]|uniref:Glycosyl transferase family 51 domain-containing protein n=1 Tax=Longimicrobium terrae TaxID=1639882 RepID=A0A841H0X6_9BACT|nr:biosynthetic peptidoglycan transglycosylase [Longimicrobium terrae]MBB4637133.1 hypothetical protein [Longimicrobium terrae]MBB6071606.1 hypothetical protein [Longimicrobium terrae]NNC29976.1 transglycosylase domain-containing protein [Longimicrobium terrae]